MAKSKWASKLKKAGAQWKKSEDRYQEMFAGKELPEDVYVTKLQEIGFAEGKNDGDIIIKRAFVVVEGEFKGVVVSDRLNPLHETGGAFVRKFLVVMGVEDVNEMELEDTEDVLAEMNKENPLCKVRVKQGDFTNVEVLSVLDDDETVDGDEPGGGEEESGEVEIDLDVLDDKGLRALIEEQEIDVIAQLGFKTKIKYKKAKEDDIRKALKEALGGGDDDEEAGASDDELLEQAKLFCGTQDIEVTDDHDLDDIKDEIKENAPYKEKDIDDEEKALLTALDLVDCIKVPKSKKK